MVIRYMGTKRHMAEHVRSALVALEPDGRVVDLFSGMGSVAESLRDQISVVTNDALSFTAAVSRARFTGGERHVDAAAGVELVRESFLRQERRLRGANETRLAAEDVVLADPSQEGLTSYMTAAKHAGNSPAARKLARAAAISSGPSHYTLATTYFSAGYLSLGQAIEVDALRSAIDAYHGSDLRDWLLASWMAAIGAVLNAPGHAAQYLHPTSTANSRRLAQTWSRSVWDEFEVALKDLDQVGTVKWRKNNDVFVGDALDLVSGGQLRNVGAVYADPPYTKDQYSRFYHLYETLYRYDFPDAKGAGRTRSDRFTTGFCFKSGVQESFHSLCRNISRMNLPLVISYPSQGILAEAGSDVRAIAREYYKSVDMLSIDAQHSTMGASRGASTKAATEHLYVCH